jgi:6-phosphogluconolactonase
MASSEKGRRGEGDMRAATTVQFFAGVLGTLCLAVLAAASPPAGAAPRAGSARVYVGTYTDGESQGIYRLRLDLATGALVSEGDPVRSVNPSFLALRPGGRFLYAVNEVGDGRGDPGGAVSAFAVDATTGGLTFLNQQPSGGASPCHLWIDTEGRHVLVANYGGGSVASLPIQEDGRLAPAISVVQHEGKGPNPERQKSPHAHYVTLDATGRHALAVDLGLDEVLVYGFDPSSGALIPKPSSTARLAPGAGPRHLAFGPGGRRAYVISELASTLTAFDYDSSTGTLTERQTLTTLPGGFSGESFTAEVIVRPDGRFLYGSNRGHDSIAIFSIDAATGRLEPAGHESTRGKWPRHFAIDPTGTYLLVANQRSDSVAVFRIDPSSGRLDPVGEPFRVPRPVCLQMVLLPE